MRMRLTFDKVGYTATKTVIIDGIKRRRSRTFYQTINPFNTNEDGSIKNRADIIRDLKKEAEEWMTRGS